MILLGMPSSANAIRDSSLADLPRIAEVQPLVGLLYLPAITDFLMEQSELITNAVADCRNAQSGQRIHVAGSQPAQTAVAEPRFRFFPRQGVEVETQFRECLLHRLADAEIQQVVPQLRTDEEFCGKISDDLDVLLPHRGKCRDPVVHQSVPDGVS